MSESAGHFPHRWKKARSGDVFFLFCFFLQTDAKNTTERTCEQKKRCLKKNSDNETGAYDQNELNFLGYVVRKEGLENLSLEGEKESSE